MTASLLTIFLMGGTFIYMMWKAEYAQTRRVALVPLGVCAVEMLLFGLHQGGGTLAVTVLLWAARAVILACCLRRHASGCRPRAAAAARRAVRRTVEAVQAASGTSRREPCPLRLVPPSSRCA